MTDRAMAELREHEARDEQLEQDKAARLERAKGYVSMGDFELFDAFQSLFARHRATCKLIRPYPHTDYMRLEKAIANEDLCEAGRLLREAVIEQVARELEDE